MATAAINTGATEQLLKTMMSAISFISNYLYTVKRNYVINLSRASCFAISIRKRKDDAAPEILLS
jgi:hypothetical protein